jgi:hypothetical protein
MDVMTRLKENLQALDTETPLAGSEDHAQDPT